MFFLFFLWLIFQIIYRSPGGCLNKNWHPAPIWHIRCALLALTLVSLIFNLNECDPLGHLSYLFLPVPSCKKREIPFFPFFPFSQRIYSGLGERLPRWGGSLTWRADEMKTKPVVRLWRERPPLFQTMLQQNEPCHRPQGCKRNIHKNTDISGMWYDFFVVVTENLPNIISTYN